MTNAFLERLARALSAEVARLGEFEDEWPELDAKARELAFGMVRAILTEASKAITEGMVIEMGREMVCITGEDVSFQDEAAALKSAFRAAIDKALEQE